MSFVNLIKKKYEKKNKYLLILFASLLFQFPAHAYAGPGAAIGAIIVAFTVILAFFASLIIGTYDLLKKLFHKQKKTKQKQKNLPKSF